MLGFELDSEKQDFLRTSILFQVPENLRQSPEPVPVCVLGDLYACSLWQFFQ